MTTPWTYPTSVTQTPEHDTHIEWYSVSGGLNVLSNLSSYHLRTVKNVLHISNATAGDIREKTWYLYCTGFNFQNVPDTISGVTVQLNVVRGRVLEETVQLLYQGNPVGDNKVYYAQDIENHIQVIPNPVYGSDTDLWNTEITSAMVADPSFGVLLRFQSHPFYPHSEVPMLHSVAMQIYG